MKKLGLLITILVLLIPIKIYAYDTSKAYDWFKTTDMIVTDSNRNKYINEYGLTGITNGTFLLNYNTTQNSIMLTPETRVKDLSISSSFAALFMLEGYMEKEDPELLSRAILVGDNIINNKKTTAQFRDGYNLTVIVPQTKMQQNGRWGYNSDYLEIYPMDSLVSASFLILLSEITHDNSYANVGIQVIDSWIHVQEWYDEYAHGGLPQFIYTNSESSNKLYTSWYIPLDIAFQVYLAGSFAYMYTSDMKYSDFVENYFDFVNMVFEQGNYKPFTKDGKEYIMPYEYVLKPEGSTRYIGYNQNNYDSSYSTTEDITTDQFFYLTLGMGIYNADNKWTKKLYETSKTLKLDNNFYWGEYKQDGTKGSNSNTTYEIVNTAFEIEMMKFMGEDKEVYNPLKRSLIDSVHVSEDPTINNAWSWSVNQNDVIEGLATSWIIYELYDKDNDDYLPDDTLGESEEDEDKKDDKKETSKGSEKVDKNPNTGVDSKIPLFIVISIIGYILYYSIDKIKLFKKM